MSTRRLLDFNCQGFRFRPGDRILVKLKHTLEPGVRKRLERSISRWAGQDVEVLVIDENLCDLEMLPGNGQPPMFLRMD